MDSAATAQRKDDPLNDRPQLRIRAALLIATSIGVCTVALVVDTTPRLSEDLEATLRRLRAYRIGVAFGAGAALALGGVVVQALFRNALASPSILGVTAGASFGGKAALIAYEALALSASALMFPAEMLVPVGCMAGATAALLLVLAIARRASSTTTPAMAGAPLGEAGGAGSAEREAGVLRWLGGGADASL